jgi:hypothetical protein
VSIDLTKPTPAGVRVGTVCSRAAGEDGKGIKREWLTDEDDDGEIVDLTQMR